MLLFYTPRKDQKTLRFSDAFRGYRKATTGCNGLKAKFGNNPLDGHLNQYCHFLCIVDSVNDVVLVYLLLTLNKFHTLFWCFHCWLWTSKCLLGKQAFFTRYTNRFSLNVTIYISHLYFYIFYISINVKYKMQKRYWSIFFFFFFLMIWILRKS